MIAKPVADHTPCPLCGHPNALHDPERGCRVITTLRCKQGKDNDFCECRPE